MTGLSGGALVACVGLLIAFGAFLAWGVEKSERTALARLLREADARADIEQLRAEQAETDLDGALDRLAELIRRHGECPNPMHLELAYDESLVQAHDGPARPVLRAVK